VTILDRRASAAGRYTPADPNEARKWLRELLADLQRDQAALPGALTAAAPDLDRQLLLVRRGHTVDALIPIVAELHRLAQSECLARLETTK